MIGWRLTSHLPPPLPRLALARPTQAPAADLLSLVPRWGQSGFFNKPRTWKLRGSKLLQPAMRGQLAQDNEIFFSLGRWLLLRSFWKEIKILIGVENHWHQEPWEAIFPCAYSGLYSSCWWPISWWVLSHSRKTVLYNEHLGNKGEKQANPIICVIFQLLPTLLIPLS